MVAVPTWQRVVLLRYCNVAIAICTECYLSLVLIYFWLFIAFFLFLYLFFLSDTKMFLQISTDISRYISTDFYYSGYWLSFYCDTGQQTQMLELLLVVLEVFLFEICLKNQFFNTRLIVCFGYQCIQLALVVDPLLYLLWLFLLLRLYYFLLLRLSNLGHKFYFLE